MSLLSNEHCPSQQHTVYRFHTPDKRIYTNLNKLGEDTNPLRATMKQESSKRGSSDIRKSQARGASVSSKRSIASRLKSYLTGKKKVEE